MLDVLKSYLVSLGFQVDNASFNKSQQSVKAMDKAVEGFAGNTVKNFATAGTAVASFFVAANIGIAKYMQGLAKADLQNEMFARRMWMSKENAVAYKNALSALGAEQQDLYLSPELLERFKELRSQASMLTAPDEYNDQMKQIRNITFEFQRLKLESTYAMQWVGYYLSKYLAKPISDIKKMMKDLNDSISKNMPSWTKDVAQVLSWIVRLGSSGVWAIQKLFHAMDELSPKTKVAGSAILGLFALMRMGPIGWMIAGLTTLLLLLDDYKTYSEGGDSLFGSEWEKLDNFKKTLEDDGTFSGFQKSLDDISTSFFNIITDMNIIADKLANGLGFEDFEDMLNKGAITALHRVQDILDGIAGALQTIDGFLSGDPSKITKGLEQFGKSFDNVLFGRDTGGHLNKAADIGGTGDIGGMFAEYFRMIVGEDVANDYMANLNQFFSGMKKTFDNLLVSPRLPYAEHADGGILTKPHFGLVAEDGPEAWIPLSASRRKNALKLLAQTSGILGAPMSGAITNTVNNYNFTSSPNYKIYGSEPTATARAISRNDDYGILMRNLRGWSN